MNLKSKMLSIVLQRLYPLYDSGAIIIVWGRFGKKGGVHAIVFNPEYKYGDHLGSTELIPRIHSREEWRAVVKGLIPYRVSITKRQ